MTIVDRAPAADLTVPTPLPDRIQQLTMDWLLSFSSPATRRAYRVHLAQWLAFAAGADINPLTASRGEGNLWARWLEVPPRSCKPATVAAKLAAVSSWYGFLVEEDAIDPPRFTAAARPKLDRMHSETVGLTEEEARALIAAADADRAPAALRTAAVIRLMVAIGPRVAEVCALQMSSLGFERGHRTVRIVGKGKKVRVRNLPPAPAAALDAYLEARARAEGVAVADLDGSLFVTASGQPLASRYLFALVQRIARDAGLEHPERVTPHTLRHTFATVADEYKAPLSHLQDALGHASPETTRRYIHARNRLEQDPSQIVAAVLG
ncbi:tyrosine recombinase XerD [Sphaerisporangium siamense]|uniref:Site-specific recombinase XerD n=1 Tax=Sphaerisporangium siamense TaxID=795645 RepID=A0A7W7G8Z8_9ACTN|nr:tyrosine-type recombinase/integrase [Sphaerisporangium siamense]MBB4702293.1 site-specific recombinase XerD [Sphaerisporangium siamense]GII89451.1 tyrosine recombinase XerD [Sphaerisporangium siamense]